MSSHQEILPKPSPSGEMGAAEAYGLLASSYDQQLNPLLTLEERTLSSLLPSLTGLCVLDLGCGTGRWLVKLADSKPAALLGVDLSFEMLAQAKSKLHGAASLANGSATDLPIADGSVDVVLGSFFSSYVEDLHALAREIHRVSRPEATLLLTDVHGVTAKKLKWERSFRVGCQKVLLQTWNRAPVKIAEVFQEEGFEVEQLVEPAFGDAEQFIFQRAGKVADAQRCEGEPAIFVCRLRKRRLQAFARATVGECALRVVGARVALDPRTSLRADVRINDGRIAQITAEPLKPAIENSDQANSTAIDLTGFLLLPGLINAHDHLEFALFPRLGNRVYEDAREWALDIHHPDDEPIRSLRSLDKSIRLQWGGIRNLLSGVTTVCHHNEYSPVFDHGFPVRVLRQYGWAHSFGFEDDLRVRVKSSPSGVPFFVHLGEGNSEAARGELWELDRRGLLNDQTVLIHALALDEPGRQLVQRRGASIVWCPSSNLFLFGQTLRREFLEACQSLALGSDSPLTCAGDLLDEMKVAHESTAMRVEDLYQLVTCDSARVLRLRNSEGTVRAGAIADLIAIRDQGISPADTLASASYRNIELVILGGRIKLASSDVRQLLPEEYVRHLAPIEVEDTVRWIDAPVGDLMSATESALGQDIRLGGKRVARA